MINGCDDVLQVIYVAVYWVEIKGLTLEEITPVMDGKNPKNRELEVIAEGKVIEGVDAEDSASVRMRHQSSNDKVADAVVTDKE